MGNYDDIINLPHHTSPTRPRMSMIDRAAQFSPFAALTGYDGSVKKIDNYEKCIVMTDKQKIAIDDVMEIVGDIFRALDNATI